MLVSAGLVLLDIDPQPLSKDASLAGAAGADGSAGSGAPQTSEDPQGSNPDEDMDAAAGFGAAAGLVLADRLKADGIDGAVGAAEGMVMELKVEGAVVLVVLGAGVEKSKRSADRLGAALDCTGGDGDEKKSSKPPVAEGLDE